jgi:RNA polymerase sigma-70 factor (ECF subfamily)
MLDPQGAAPGITADLASLRAYLFKIARRRLGRSRPDASPGDFVQLALLKACEAGNSCRATCPSQLRGWLRKILINLIRGGRRSTREVPLEMAPIETIAAPSSDPISEAHRNERARHLVEAVAKLPTDQQRVIKLRFEEQLRYREIGRILGRSRDAVRMLLGRALERLQRLLNDLDDTP